MASAPKPVGMPLFYNDLVPLSSSEHGNWRSRGTDKASWLAGHHAVPLTVEEFPLAQRFYPIVFSGGPDPVPLGLMGLNEGINVFVDDDGTVSSNTYLPAYARRYPFMLAKLRPDSDDLSLCFDPTTDLIGEFEDGAPLFDGAEPSESCKASLNFCEQFEVAASKTANFVSELKKHGLLMEGELNLEITGQEKPFHYRGFSMIDEKKLRDVRGDVLRGWNQNGMLPLIYAHLFSLDLVRDIFTRQVALGKGPLELPPAN